MSSTVPRLDDRAALRRYLAYAPVLDRVAETTLGSGPAWEFGDIGIMKGWPGYETNDLPGDLAPHAAFRKIAFDYPDENFRGVAAVLNCSDDYDLLAGWVPPEREAQLDEWIAFLNGEIRRLVGKASAT